jgi:hypothetical protein
MLTREIKNSIISMCIIFVIKEINIMINKKYFVVSDMHSFYDELISALSIAGYSKDNESHILIVNGDVFDRGPKSKEMFKFLTSIPKDRLVLIKGNHEYILLNLFNSAFPNNSDFSNGTVYTMCQLASSTPDEARELFISLRDGLHLLQYTSLLSISNKDVDKKLVAQWKKIVRKVKKLGVEEWLKSDEWNNFYELNRFIFTHCFIPLRNPFNIDIYNNFNYSDYLYYNKDWRTDATDAEWYSAVWGCPWRLYDAGFFKQEEDNGKTLVCGHWHTSDFYKYFNKDFNDTSEIFYSSGIIAIDGGVYYKNGELYHPCNVLIIENNKCYNKYGEELKEVNINNEHSDY